MCSSHIPKCNVVSMKRIVRSTMATLTLMRGVVQGDENERYHASLYYLRKGANWIIHFVISKDLEAHTKVSFMQVHSFVEYCCYSWLWLQFVEQKYTTKGCISGPSQRIKFEANTISLELPSENTILSDGWKIIPLIHPKVKLFYMHYWTELQYMEYIIICKFSDH